MSNKTLIVLVGPTAVGKTKVSVMLAKSLGCSIINADSRQVFKELSIGTAKPTKEEMQGVKHYFVGDRSIEEEISAGIFEREALQALNKEFTSNDICILSGGSGLYIEALVYGLDSFPKVDPEIRQKLSDELKAIGSEQLHAKLMVVDPEYAAEIEPQNSQRIIRALEIFHASGQKYSSLRLGTTVTRNFKTLFIGLELPRAELYERINSRMDVMISAGLFNEALNFINHREKNALQTVGYNEVYLLVDGKVDKTEAIRLLKRNSRRFAKRQLTWFKRNKATTWFNPNNSKEILVFIKKKLDA